MGCCVRRPSGRTWTWSDNSYNYQGAQESWRRTDPTRRLCPDMESEKEYTQDAMLGVAFLVVSVFGTWRTIIYFSPEGGGKVITLFYSLISMTALVRAIWFLIPSSVLEGSYTPVPLIAFKSYGWKGVLTSEIMLAMGSLLLYAVFLLIVCYWAHMVQKVEHPESPESSYLLHSQQSLARYPRQAKTRRGPMETFGIMMLFLCVAEAANIMLYMFQVFNSEQMILYDSVLFALTSVATLIAISIFSGRIRVVLTTIGVINSNSTRPQVRRILAITVAANIFFILRLAIELTVAVALVVRWMENKSFYIMISDKYWVRYIFIKHWSEVVVLVLELLISTAMSTQRAPSASGERTTARQGRRHQNRRVALHESELLPLKSTADV